MAPPSDCKPAAPRRRMPLGWNEAGRESILFPEGAIKLQGTGRQVLERCDGQRTFGEIIAELQSEFGTDRSSEDSRRHQRIPGAVAEEANRGLLRFSVETL